jgi:hypothetical protein
VEEGVTVKGNTSIYIHTDSDGAFVVDEANDVMMFDRWLDEPKPHLKGAAEFNVSAGQLFFDGCNLDYDLTGEWNVSGGMLEMSSDCRFGDGFHQYIQCDMNLSGGELFIDDLPIGYPPCFMTRGKFVMSGGTLDVDENFEVTGGAELSGGRIEVKHCRWAEFRH